jgi:SAM-dependent methyltransferase
MADSSLPDFWDTRYETSVTPWDAGRVPDALRRHRATFPPGARVLVPGCGSGYEVHCLAENGFDVLAIDFSPAAVARAQKQLGRFAHRVRLADFFDFDLGGRGFDVIYERAFLCALPQRLWQRYAQRSAQLLAPGGRITGFFYFDDSPRGPPFGTSDAELQALLSPWFERIEDEPVTDSLPVFQGKERWQVWVSRGQLSPENRQP